MSWTLFWDMHSGGEQKLEWAKIYVEATSEEQAIAIFRKRFDRNPHNVTCSCCGCDYAISTSPTLEEESAYHRNDCQDAIGPTLTLEEYIDRPDVCVVPASESS